MDWKIKPCPPPTFEEFLAALRQAEADGTLIVLKWPTHDKDDFQVKLLKDENGKRISED